MMISRWVSVMAALVMAANGASNKDDTEPCAKIYTSSSVVPLGSPVTATCIIREDCILVAGQAVQVDWHLGADLIPSSLVVNGSSKISRAVISSFNHTREVLTCCIHSNNIALSQVLAGVEVRAGYPPEPPQNLSCQTNLTNPNTLTCRWDPGLQETHLRTNYTLHTEIWDVNRNFTYELPVGVHHYIIPRSHFVLFSEMKIYVKAVNDLGEATSAPVILEPVGAAKFDPPKILDINAPKEFGCLKLKWSLSKHQAWIRNGVSLEVRFKAAGSDQWSDPPIRLNHVRLSRAVQLCHLLDGTRYLAQIRVRYQQSPWSEWSSSKSGVTSETAPTGRLSTWMKIARNQTSKLLNIQLFWKPTKQFRANGQNVSYIVSVQKLPSKRWNVCTTIMNYCTFKLSARVKKLYLRAENAAGKSSPTEIRIYQNKAQEAILDVAAVPRDDRSFLVQWTTVDTLGPVGYVVEWRPLLEAGLSSIQFEILDKNHSSLVITGSFEPYKPYGISVYPRFKDGIGPSKTVNAFLRQKAPSMVPEIQIKETWWSYAELTWDEIPLEERNGNIKDYKIFYREDKGPVKVMIADPVERKVILDDLNTESLYEAFMMVSTFGGSRNGSTFHFKMKSFGMSTVTVIASAVGLTLVIIFIALICFCTQKRLKGHFWPVVPDPANSSIKRWTSESTQFIHLSSDSEEPNPIYLSHLSFLDMTTKLSKEKVDNWLNSTEDTSDLGESICGSPFIPEYSGSNSDSVPYATVLLSGPGSSPLPKESRVYLRSESTQPLLETEELFSPKCYQNVMADETPREQCFFGQCDDHLSETGEDPAIVWDDFPFLRALAMNDTENDLII